MASSVPENIAIPPKEIKDVIEKSILYIQKNGKTFEERLLKNNKNNQFNFLKPDDQFHEYYLWALKSHSVSLGPTMEKDAHSETSANFGSGDIPKPKDLEFLIKDFPSICERDLQIIKMTAMYIAVNGGDKIKELIKHEHDLGRGAQFEFLKPQHSLHNLLQVYVKQYEAVKKAISDSTHQIQEDLSNTLKEAESGSFAILTKAYERALYFKQNKVRRKKQDEQLKQKRIHFASIDWQDFTIVEAVKFDAIDAVRELSVPLKRDDLLKRSLTERNQDLKLPKFKPVTSSVEEKGNNLEALSPADRSEESPMENTTPPPFKGMKIKAAGTTRIKRNFTAVDRSGKVVSTSDSTDKIKCPVTGKLIPADDFDNHLRNILRDPSYKQQQENYLRKNFSYESNITSDQAFENIKRLMRKRHTEEHDGQQGKE
ncbi:PRP21 [Candida theae]|uniref:PRP21 n=1 Tax=Candida theae TaxID=1198502 RepID=A0AAD5BH61_9ASCO|nr:PRP21 [Candida theae]KAI5962895.1 PRP21 [Candida theae]